MKVLIIRFSSIGDIVLTTPVVRCVKEQLKDVELHFLTKDSFYSTIADNPHIDRVHLLKGSIKETVNDLREEKFDFIIDLHRNIRTAAVKRGLHVKSSSFDKLNWEKWLLVNCKINKLPDIHIVDRYFNAVAKLGVVNDGKGLDFFISEEDELNVNSLPLTHREGYVAVPVGAAHYTKTMPDAKLMQICKMLDLPVVLLGGKKEFEKGEKIASGNAEKILNYCGKLSLGQSASIIRNAKVVVTPDTGMMHIAAAFQKKIVSIWGNTVPSFGMYAYMPINTGNSVIIENKNLKCRPCSKIGFKECPKKHFKCMNDLDNELIVSAVKKFWVG